MSRKEPEPDTTQRFERLAKGVFGVSREDYETARAKYEREKAERKKRAS